MTPAASARETSCWPGIRSNRKQIGRGRCALSRRGTAKSAKRSRRKPRGTPVAPGFGEPFCHCSRGAGIHGTLQSERTGIEDKWFALPDRVIAVKVEADGDLHLALQDATGDKPGIVIVEVPAKPQWCQIRSTV